VTGVLPVALGDATKIAGALLLSGKEYVGLMQLHSAVSMSRIYAAFEEFTGEIYQRPPLRASVKHEVRRRTIYSLEMLEANGRYVLFKAACEAGTYVRKICHDIGEVLGVGAHMRELRRIRAGGFTEDKHLRTLYDLIEAYAAYENRQDEQAIRESVRPMEEAFEYVPKIYCRDSAVDAICHGASLAVPGVVKIDSSIRPNMPVAIFTLKGEVVALAQSLMSADQMLEQDRGMAARTARVIMKSGTYPKMWKSKKPDSSIR